MPELERWILHRLATIDGELRAAANGFEFNRYLALLTGFANDELSALLFDVRKDCLYCDAPASLWRRGLSQLARYPVPCAGALGGADPVLHRRGGLADAFSVGDRFDPPADLAGYRPGLAR